MDKKEYKMKMKEILNDKSIFEIIDKDPTIEQEDKLNRKLLKLKKENFITEEEYQFCRSTGSQPARIYGLPKTHKTGVPLRPIVSASGTFNYILAKLLVRKLEHLRQNQLMIKDSFSFIEQLHSLKIDTTNTKLVSFDVTSLFTPVPLQKTIEIILEKLYGLEHTCTQNKKKRETWCKNCKNRSEMRWLLETSTKETHFIFDKNIYIQKNVIAMGSSLGPLFADIYMNYLESKLMPKLKENGLLFWRRFVDDTFTILRKDADIAKLIEILNSFDTEIIFTSEEETNNSIAFLDILITRAPSNSPKSSFSTTIYRKATYTGLLTKWQSFIPESYKASVVSTMVYRAIKICSSFKLMHDEFEFIKNISVKNGYPKKFIESQIKKTLDRYYQKSDKTKVYSQEIKDNKITKNTQKIKEQIFLDIPYVGKPTEILGKRIINIAKQINPQLQLFPIHRPSPSIAKSFPTKDLIPKDLQSNIVYLINCSKCDASYVGKTIRQASRFREHSDNLSINISSESNQSVKIPNATTLRRSKRIEEKNTKYHSKKDHANENNNYQNIQVKSALRRHEIDTGHEINWKILSKDKKHYRLLIRESLLIQNLPPILNKTVCSAPLIVYPEGLQSSKPKVKIKQ